MLLKNKKVILKESKPNISNNEKNKIKSYNERRCWSFLPSFIDIKRKLGIGSFYSDINFVLRLHHSLNKKRDKEKKIITLFKAGSTSPGNTDGRIALRKRRQFSYIAVYIFHKRNYRANSGNSLKEKNRIFDTWKLIGIVIFRINI